MSFKEREREAHRRFRLLIHAAFLLKLCGHEAVHHMDMILDERVQSWEAEHQRRLIRELGGIY